MAASAEKHHSEEQLQALNDAIGTGGFLQIRRMINGLPPADAAHLIESTPQTVRALLWQLVGRGGHVLSLPLPLLERHLGVVPGRRLRPSETAAALGMRHGA